MRLPMAQGQKKKLVLKASGTGSAGRRHKALGVPGKRKRVPARRHDQFMYDDDKEEPDEVLGELHRNVEPGGSSGTKLKKKEASEWARAVTLEQLISLLHLTLSEVRVLMVDSV